MKAATTQRTPREEQILAHAEAAPLRLRNLFTLDDWNWYVREKVEQPNLDTFATNNARLIYNSHLRLVAHPEFDRALLRASLTFRGNEHRTEGPLDTVIDGPAGTGKTFLLRAIGREYQAWVEGKEAGRIPVVHITVPHDTDGKVNWVWEIACFLGLNPPPKDDRALLDLKRLPDLTHPVTHVLARARTRMLLIDDIQRTTPDQLGPALHYFDYLRSRHGVATIFCGTGAADIVQAARVRVDNHRDADTNLRERVKTQRAKAGLPEPDPSKQEPVRSELSVTWLDPIHCHEADQKTSLKVLKGFEDNLCLHNLSEHALTQHAAYLHKRTGGYLKHLSHLICQAAVDAMREGDENITLERLTTIRVGHNDDA
ncbi:AAA family ATPase [Kitasatospora cathayae]|uniref:AAA family ATPase n=1 Tax=Kitasatospora cathayae TaxID=3004092 RepID=A0ABY7QGW5_9ACTN|nr:AAA family ATPase [Kitasatospora sp. HUAS 3-15]WBP92054.1 AAA family ATPase [Kitasatospora sp. HUAS 3-15]